VRTGVIAPTLGYEVPDPELDLDYVPGESRPLVAPNGHPPLALSNSFAFGGHNVTLAIRAAKRSGMTHAADSQARPDAERRRSA
jgi:3-oxoacyl-(acyl-carrier-protein) synthase